VALKAALSRRISGYSRHLIKSRTLEFTGPVSSFSIRRTGVRSAVTNSPYLAPRTDCFALETRSCWEFRSMVRGATKPSRSNETSRSTSGDHNPKVKSPEPTTSTVMVTVRRSALFRHRRRSHCRVE